MPARYFSIEEVNRLLPLVNDLLGELLERRARVVSARSELADVIEDPRSNVGSAAASAVAHEFILIERIAERLEELGVQLKDVNGGIVDFLSQRDGRDVFLCWRYGEEPVIRYYHDLHTGFAGRRPIREDDDFWTEER